MPTFSLRYYSKDHLFSNPVYEDAAIALVQSIREKEKSPAAGRELLNCILEGTALPDYLLPEEILTKLIGNAAGLHEQNYYRTQMAIRKQI